MHYFLNTNAKRPVVVAGRSFLFEPVALRGGTWLGVLAVEDQASADSILAARPDQVDEISVEYYDSLKKKETADVRNSHPEPSQWSQGVAVAEPAARAIGQTTVKAAPAPAVDVELLTTSDQPPDEPLLAHTVSRKGKPW